MFLSPRGVRGADREMCRVLMGGSCSAVILEKICEYFYYNEKYRDAKDVPDMEIPPELALELLMVADFLHT